MVTVDTVLFVYSKVKSLNKNDSHGRTKKNLLLCLRVFGVKDSREIRAGDLGGSPHFLRSGI
jgi:hypothetical protein